MKNLNLLVLILAVFSFNNIDNNLNAQSFNQSKKVAVLSVQANNMQLTSEQAAKILRNALIELDTFEVIDPYDMSYILEQDQIDVTECFSISCLSTAGKSLDADMMMTGTIERILDKIVVSLRVVNVKSKRITQRSLVEFVDIENQLKSMIKITLNKMYNRSSDKTLVLSLTKENQYESTINNPKISKLQLSGPRIGLTLLTGESAEIFRKAENVGGFDGRSVMFQFGYQFEISYLNQGPIQALFEIIPMVSGLDQGRFIPTVSFLNGIRSNVSGWEFAIGPLFMITSKADGYINEDGNWVILDKSSPKDVEIVKQTDSRGIPTFDTGLVFAFGKSFKSGKINFPVNLFTVVNRNSFRVGISMGFNATEN